MLAFTPPPHQAAHWQVGKPAARGRLGVVVAQAHAAAEAGLAMLDAGGNAVDAAVATAFALAVVEPWNSGLGGVGFAVVHPAGQPRAEVVDFGPLSPSRLDPAAFRLTGRKGADLFGWPEVEGDANVHGPLSFCVPSAVAGYHAMHARWGRLPVADVLEPAIALARRGLPADWFTLLKVAQSAATLKLYPETQRIYLPGGLPRPAENPAAFIRLGRLADTLERLAHAGLHDFYNGNIANAVASDCASRDGVLAAADLRHYRVGVGPAVELPWRGHTLQLATARTAAPALAQVLERMADVLHGPQPGPGWYVALSRALQAAQARRRGAEGSTTHVSVCDAEGGMVALTTTLLSSFGSRVVLPQSDVLMNNGVMWFDPRPGRANSVLPDARPLTNMCPLVMRSEDRPVLALGASGGRRILPAVLQVLAYVVEFGVDAADAVGLPRIDVSEPGVVTADHRLPPDVLRADGAVQVVEPTLLPGSFAAPNIVVSGDDGTRVGAADAASPWSAALAQV